MRRYMPLNAKNYTGASWVKVTDTKELAEVSPWRSLLPIL